MFLTKAKVATALLLALGLIVAGTGVLTHQALAAKQTETQAASEAGQAAKPKDKGEGAAPVARAQPVAEETLKVRGRVLGPDGKPFAGAKLYLGFVTPTAPAHSVRATSGDDGRFEFAFAKSELHKTNGAAQVMAIAKGHGCDWVKLDPAEKELTLRLTKEVPLSGRILDADGRPVVGAKLTVDGVAAVTGVKQGAFAFVHHLPYGRDNAKDWVGALPGQPAVLSTGADGRFRLTGVGHDRVVSLHLEGPGIATADFGVTPGASVGHVAASSRPIRGVVRDQATGKPLAGASVFLNWYINPRYEQPRWGKAITDKEGRYELLGLAKAQRYNLMATPPKGQLYFQRRVDVQDTPGLDPLTADIDMAQGLTVRGKITDKATGKPVAGAMVDYHPLYANPNVNKLAGFWHPRSEATTGADGSYALTVLPGPGVIGVVGPDPDAFMTAVVTVKERKDFFKLPVVWNDQESYLVPAVGGNAGGAPLMLDSYNALVLLEPSEKEKTLRKDVALALPLERKGRVVGPDGQLIAGVTVSGLWPGWIKVETLKGAEFTVHGLNPRAKRQLVFHHKGKNLGFLLKELPDEKSGPLTVKLQPCGSISGRIVDQDDQPLAGEHIPGGVGGSVSFTTDKEGRFHVEGLVPGLGYVLMRPRVVATVLVEFVVESGKNKDLGDLKLDK